MDIITVEQWKEVFMETGLSEEDMLKWHRIFEKKYPEGHQHFLEWLGIKEDRIAEIRKSSQ